ncbi:MAG: ferrous iron transport protein A [Candidatus Bipolaricaulota bacterium]|nr:MAG: ferrous iron transport protein A [Candidatus Bipolaricaulota bacterium]
MSVSLERLPPMQSATVCEIRGGPRLRRDLHRMGIHVGDVLRVVGSGALGGPLLVEVHGGRVALGRGVARRVEVCPLGACVASSGPASGRWFRRHRGG